VVKSLEAAIQKAGSPVKLLWESTTQPAIVPRVVPEFTNWRDEQLAWRRTAVLFDQSHHMADLNIKGPDALKVISKLAINSVAKFPVDMAKQFVAVNHDGYVIGDNILFHLEEDEYHQLAALSRRDGRARRAHLARRQLVLSEGRPGPLPLPGPGPGRDGCDS
jgi:glycine cleavage system aminomethyltransferase T